MSLSMKGLALTVAFLTLQSHAILRSEKSKMEMVPGAVVIRVPSEWNQNRFEEEFYRLCHLARLKSCDSAEVTPLFSEDGTSLSEVENLRYISVHFPSLAIETTAALRETRNITRALNLTSLANIAEPDYRVHVTKTVNDTYFPPSKGAWNQPFYDEWPLTKLSIAQAWDTADGSGQVVAVVDTGVDYNHPELQGKVIKGYNYIAKNNDPMDDFGHGTHVSGTIAAIANNSTGIAGVAPAAKILAVKVLDSSGSGTFQDVADGIKWAADHGATVINMSLGGYVPDVPQYITDSLAYAHSKDVVTVVAAGNDSSDANDYSPASDNNVVTIAASTSDDKAAYFSNFGEKIAVAAPGGGDQDTANTEGYERSILSLLAAQHADDMVKAGNTSLIVGNNYVRQAGTSMASPHVAGVAALVRSVHPDYNAEQVRQALQLGTDNLGATGFQLATGYGRINAAKAVAVSAPLAVQITAPFKKAVGTSVDVVGMVSGANVANWTLAYETASKLGTWNTIASGAGSVAAGGKLATWKLSGLANERVNLKLTATSTTGQAYEYRYAVDKSDQ